MHRILSLLALGAFTLEEIAHQRRRARGTLPAAPVDENDKKTGMDIFDVLRLLELLFLALLMSTSAGNPAGSHGQMAMILAGLQISRLFGRRILSRWSVLGVLQALEIVILLLIILLPLNTAVLTKPVLSSSSILALGGGVLYGVMIAICASFSISYGIKLFSGETSEAFDNFPPLADSENWAVKFSARSIYPAIAGTAGLVMITGFSLLSLLFLFSALLQGTGLFLANRSSFRGHHPVSHLLWSLSFLLLMGMMVFGVTDITGS